MMRSIYCCGCGRDVLARLTDGKEIYERRADLADRPFWKCDACKNYVGCHHKRRGNTTEPLGNIPTKELRGARQNIHALLDPLWRGTVKKRAKIYRKISESIGYEYHTAEIKTVEDARKIYRIVNEIAKGAAS